MEDRGRAMGMGEVTGEWRPQAPARHSTSALLGPPPSARVGVAGYIPRAILAFLWYPLSGATPFRKKTTTKGEGALGLIYAQGARWEARVIPT